MLRTTEDWLYCQCSTSFGLANFQALFFSYECQVFSLWFFFQADATHIATRIISPTFPEIIFSTPPISSWMNAQDEKRKWHLVSVSHVPSAVLDTTVLKLSSEMTINHSIVHIRNLRTKELKEHALDFWDSKAHSRLFPGHQWQCIAFSNWPHISRAFLIYFLIVKLLLYSSDHTEWADNRINLSSRRLTHFGIIVPGLPWTLTELNPGG